MVPAHAAVEFQHPFLLVIHVETHHLACAKSRPSAAETPASATAGEAHVVHVVGIAEAHETEIAVETCRHNACGIAVLRAYAEVGVGEHALVHAFLQPEVEHSLLFAIVNARHPSQVALLVIRLYLLYN